MKKLVKILVAPLSIVVLVGLFFIFQSFAVKSGDGEKQVTIKVVKLINGVETVVDTTISFTDQAELDEILKNLNIGGHISCSDSLLNLIDLNIDTEGDEKVVKMCVHVDGEGKDINIDSLLQTLDIEIGEGDSNGNEMKIVTATIGEEGKVKTKSVEKSIVIKMDGENIDISEGEDVKVFMIKDGEEGEVHEIIKGGEVVEFKSDGKEKIIIKSDCSSEGEEMTVDVYELEDGKKKIVIESKICIVKLSNDDENKLKDSGMVLAEDKSELVVEHLQFYPNPTSGKFNLKFDLENKDDTYIKVFDLNGKEIYTEKLKKFSGTYDKEIDISNNGKGTYFLNIIQGDKVLNKKILVQ